MGVTDGTIKAVVADGLRKELRHSALHYKVAEVDIHGNKRIYNNESIIDRYRDVLLAHTRTFTFTDEEMEKYRWQPRVFCRDKFNNVDLWSVLLRINNMITNVDFDRRTIRIFGPRFVPTLKALLTLEDEEMTRSAEEAEKK